MKNNKWIILIIIGVLLICSSIGLLLYNKYIDNQAGIKSREIYEKLHDTMNGNKDVDGSEKIINIDGNAYIGVISIPVLDLELPVMSECDEKKMKIAPCKYYGDVNTNDLVICAHSYKNLFRNIKNLNQGDKVIITDISNQAYVYEVEVIEILAPENVKEMIESEFDLTLYTCTNDNLNRITVRLNRI